MTDLPDNWHDPDDPHWRQDTSGRWWWYADGPAMTGPVDDWPPPAPDNDANQPCTTKASQP